jgi:glycosyltransferase involved in cell wall biosynthesis
VRLRVPVRVHIAGGADQGRPESESYARELRARIDRAGLGEVCTLHGTLTQAALVPLLHRAHLFVAPYVETEAGDKDGIPTAMLEAMSTGLGVVATDAGAIAEVIDDGVEGRIVPQRDAAAMARVIAALAADAAAVTELGARARRRFEVELDASVTERALAERVQGLLRSRDSSARPQQ